MFWHNKKARNRITNVVLEKAKFESKIPVSFDVLYNWFFYNAYVYKTILPPPKGYKIDDYVNDMITRVEIVNGIYVYKGM